MSRGQERLVMWQQAERVEGCQGDRRGWPCYHACLQLGSSCPAFFVPQQQQQQQEQRFHTHQRWPRCRPAARCARRPGPPPLPRWTGQWPLPAGPAAAGGRAPRQLRGGEEKGWRGVSEKRGLSGRASGSRYGAQGGRAAIAQAADHHKHTRQEQSCSGAGSSRSPPWRLAMSRQPTMRAAALRPSSCSPPAATARSSSSTPSCSDSSFRRNAAAKVAAVDTQSARAATNEAGREVSATQQRDSKARTAA